jgi:hypothetical protein
MTPQEVLKKAAALIDKQGLAKGVFQDKNGCFCMYGGARIASNDY